MTTVEIPAQPRELPELTADPGQIRTCGEDLLSASAQVDDLGTFAAGGATIGDWTGNDATAYHESVRTEGATADAMSLALRGVAQAVDLHADEIQSLEERRVDLATERTRLTGSIDNLWEATRNAVTEEDVAPLLTWSRELKGEIAAFDSDVGTWLTDIANAESDVNNAFAKVLTMAGVHEHYDGAADPADAALATRPGPDASPQGVHGWWTGLTEEQRQAILAASPEAIGNLDGIPAGARSEANTVALNRDLAEWRMLRDEGLLTSDEEDWLATAEATEAGIDKISGAKDPATGLPVEAQLWLYDPRAFDGEGRVGVVAGNLDTADNVVLTVPGFSTDGSSMGELSERALNIYGASRYNDPGQTTASMMWIGYDAPDFNGGVDGVGVGFESMAENGGARLADAIDGLRASRPGDPAHMTVVGHSYGSTTTGHAATDHGLHADDLVLVGSPGPGDDAETATDLGVGSGHVWVGTASRDVVGNLGDMGWVNPGNVGTGLGNDPSSDDFGARRFQAESTSREPDDNVSDHSKYWDHDSESLANIAEIVTGQYGDVTLAEHKYDPWYAEPQDPEWDRDPTTRKTR